MKTQILKIYNKNVIILNRGFEDAIFQGDHIKVTSDDGFIARGICLRTTALTSHWKVYRVVRPQLVSMDTEYKMRSINQSEIPEDYLAFGEVDFSKYYNKYGDKDVLRGLKLQQARLVKSDLPLSAAQTKFKEREGKSTFDSFVSDNFKSEDLKEDLQTFSFGFYASPISWQSRDKQVESHFGASLGNTGKKYQFNFGFEKKQKKFVDPVTKNEFSSEANLYTGGFQLNRITENFSVVSKFMLRNEKIGEIEYPKKHLQLGFFGLKYHIWEENTTTDFMDISYVPLLDDMEYSSKDLTNTLQRKVLRHEIALRLHSRIIDNLYSQTHIIYAPSQELSGEKLTSKDTNTRFMVMLSWKLGGDFFADYKIDFEKDILRSEVYNIDSDNTTQSVRFRYAVDI